MDYQNFNPGDKLLCIDDSKQKILVNGRIYTVTEPIETGFVKIEEHKRFGFKANRFRLVKDTDCAVCAIIEHPKIKGLFLSVSRKDNHKSVGFPGGKVDEGETLEQAIYREVLEETGYRITSIKSKVFALECKGYYTTTFLCKVNRHNVQEVSEHETGLVSWVTADDLSVNSQFAEYNKQCLEYFNLGSLK